MADRCTQWNYTAAHTHPHTLPQEQRDLFRSGFAELNELRRNNYTSKRAGNYFSGRANRTKSEINHAASRERKGCSMRDGKKGERGRLSDGGANGGAGVDACLPPRRPPRRPPLFHSLPRSLRYPGRRMTLPFLRLTQMRGRHTFNSLLIRRLLLLPPLARRVAPGSRHSSSLYFEHSTRRV